MIPKPIFSQPQGEGGGSIFHGARESKADRSAAFVISLSLSPLPLLIFFFNGLVVYLDSIFRLDGAKCLVAASDNLIVFLQI